MDTSFLTQRWYSDFLTSLFAIHYKFGASLPIVGYKRSAHFGLMSNNLDLKANLERAEKTNRTSYSQMS